MNDPRIPDDLGQRIGSAFLQSPERDVAAGQLSVLLSEQQRLVASSGLAGSTAAPKRARSTTRPAFAGVLASVAAIGVLGLGALGGTVATSTSAEPSVGAASPIGIPVSIPAPVSGAHGEDASTFDPSLGSDDRPANGAVPLVASDQSWAEAGTGGTADVPALAEGDAGGQPDGLVPAGADLSVESGEPEDDVEEQDTSEPALADAMCDGLVATIIGTDEPDTIIGTDGPDVIVGGDGADVILGLGGDDVICGGNGADQIDGGEGDDLLIGDNGPDELVGGDGEDRVVGDNGTDVLEGEVVDPGRGRPTN